MRVSDVINIVSDVLHQLTGMYTHQKTDQMSGLRYEKHWDLFANQIILQPFLGL